MAHITVSKEARKDLIAIRQYIREELANPLAMQRITAEIKKGILSLKAFPERGCPLDALIFVHTAYRYLVCGNYYVFYLHNHDDVLIVRILHQRQNFMKALFIDK